MSKTTSKPNKFHAFDNELNFFEEIRPAIENSPIKAINLLRGFHRNSLKGHHKRIKSTIVHAYACALKLKNDERLTEKFYSKDFFSKRKHVIKTSDLLRMTLCYIFGSLEGSDYRQALSYERAVRPFFTREASQDELANELSNKSLDDLEGEAKVGKNARKKDRRGQAGNNGPTKKDGPKTNEADKLAKDKTDDSNESSDGSRASGQAAQGVEAQDKSTIKQELDLRDLRLEADPKLSLRVITDPAYKNGTIDYNREVTASGFVRIIVTAAHPKA